MCYNSEKEVLDGAVIETSDEGSACEDSIVSDPAITDSVSIEDTDDVSPVKVPLDDKS